MSDDAIDTSAEVPAPEQSTETRPTVADDSLLADLLAGHPSVEVVVFAPTNGPPQDIALVPAADYHPFVGSVRDSGFDVFSDLCGVDYLRRRPRYEVVVNLLSHHLRRRIRIRAGVDGPDPVIASISDLYQGANSFEREAYDMFGIRFTGHPDLTRILMPDDWEGHPLRKDYALGSVPVQFKGAHEAS